MATTLDDSSPIPYEPPTSTPPPGSPPPPFYSWSTVYPFLRVLVHAAPAIAAEVRRVPNAFVPWPEASLYQPGMEWRVLPFLHTFPADDPTTSTWVPSTTAACPSTVQLLKRLPGIRTALVSRMGPRTSLTPHAGWAALSNHVLRVHVGLDIPGAEHHASGVVVGEDHHIQYHSTGGVLVFDDSLVHSAFNHHATLSRTVLIIDILRPPGFPPGSSDGEATPELLNIMQLFK